MYFNDAARDASPDVYQRFVQAALDHQKSTLAQLPATVLRLLGYQISPLLTVMQALDWIRLIHWCPLSFVGWGSV
ncbi:hypothetical protein [Castellaniella sp.]|uniref:hypothetical protein n=1 Tax=Castellaniella sp. TaxID=1955812 RepID=UPI002AFFDCF2|nr:hypothetical protein [Castellaniella sp.]